MGNGNIYKNNYTAFKTMQPVFVFFFFSLVPSFKTCLGLGKTIFLFGEELTFGSCKYQSVARLYSGGKRVELSTVMVS